MDASVGSCIWTGPTSRLLKTPRSVLSGGSDTVVHARYRFLCVDCTTEFKRKKQLSWPSLPSKVSTVLLPLMHVCDWLGPTLSTGNLEAQLRGRRVFMSAISRHWAGLLHEMSRTAPSSSPSSSPSRVARCFHLWTSGLHADYHLSSKMSSQASLSTPLEPMYSLLAPP